MQKKLTTLLAAALLAGALPVCAAVPTLAEKTERIEEVIYGAPQTGALIERTEVVQRAVYGGILLDKGLSEKVDILYDDVVKSDTEEPSLVTRVNTLEWQLRNHISRDSLLERIAAIENSVYGSEQKGTLRQRVLRLENTVYENRHYELREVEMPADTVFKISLDDEVGTKISREGDKVDFSVAEDVFIGDVLVLPQGAMGTGTITKVKKPRSFGRQGELKIEFKQVFGIDDEPIATVLGAEAEEKLKHEAAAIGASAVGAMALGPIGLVGGFFIKGSDVELPAGTELYIQVQDTVMTHGVLALEGAPKYTEAKIETSIWEKETNAEQKEKARMQDAEEVEETADTAVTDSDDTAIETSTDAKDSEDTENTAVVTDEPATEVTVDEGEEEVIIESETMEPEVTIEPIIEDTETKVEEIKEKADEMADEKEEEHLPVVIIRQE